MKKNFKFILISIIVLLIVIIIFQHAIIKEKNFETSQKSDEISLLIKDLNYLASHLEIYKEQKKRYDDLNLTEKERKIDEEFQKIDIEIQKCMKKENYTTMGMSHCVLISEPKYEKIIQTSISGLKKIVTPKTYSLILDSQKKWEMYRDSQKKVIYNTIWNLQGTMHINISDGEAVYITEQRAKDLADILNMMKDGNYIK